jgi:hypothetical protein
VEFDLQFNWLSNVSALNFLKNFVVFDEYCKQLLTLKISAACDLLNYILEIWLVVIVWQKFYDKRVLVEREFKKAFLDIHLIDLQIAKF